MNALTTIRQTPPTAGEPIPSLAGTHGLMLLRSAPVSTRAMMSEADRAAMTEASEAICASLTPSRAEWIAVEIEGLALHYPAFSRTDRENIIANGHWLADLENWPIDLIREACRLWRNSSERYFPTPGQLKALMEPVLKHREALARRAHLFLAECEAKA